MYKRQVWDLPKGKIDYGESDEKAAIREVCEETGVCDLTLVKRLEPTYHIYFSNNEAYLKETHWSVSYTHLDVYKRQILSVPMPVETTEILLFL